MGGKILPWRRRSSERRRVAWAAVAVPEQVRDGVARAGEVRVPDTGASRLPALDALRAVAALGVVSFHVNNYFLPLLVLRGEDAGSFWRIGQHGVEIFFALSGFLVLLRHPGERGPRAAGAFLGGRGARLLPFYWLALACVALGILAAPAFGARLGAGHLTGGRLLAAALLLPGAAEPVMGVAWTLELEALFYLVFALTLLDPARGWPVLLGWMAASAAALLVAPPGAFAAALSPFNLCFGLGMLAAWLRPRIAPGTGPGLGLIGAAMILAGGLGEMEGPGWGEGARVAIFGAGGALLVLGLSHAARAPRALRALGRGSYAIYLVHGSALTLLAPLAGRLPGIASVPAGITLAALTAAAAGAGMLAHRLVERRLPGLGLRPPAPRAAPGAGTPSEDLPGRPKRVQVPNT